MLKNYPMLPTCNRKLVLKMHSAILFNAVQNSTEALPHGKIHTDTHSCARVSWKGPQATERSISPEVGWWEEVSSAKYQQQDQCSMSSSASAGFWD